MTDVVRRVARLRDESGRAISGRRSRANRDPARLGGLGQRQGQLQHSVVVARGDVLGVDLGRQRERPLERAVGELRGVTL